MSNIFRAYDIRGVYPEEINKENAYKIGFAVVKFLQAKSPNKKLNLVVGEDCRLASPTLRGAVIDAMTKAGANVSYISLCTTPLFYYSVNELKADGGIMITASHNPPQYGGIKIVGFESRPIGVESGLKEIEKLSQGLLEPAPNIGKIEEVSMLDNYINFVVKESGIGLKPKKLKLVIDAGNGMTPIVLKPLFQKLGISYTPLYFEIDCNFPNHSPDISKEENLSDLKAKSIQLKADLGIAFDGDGDRIIFIDNNGNRINSSYILALIFKNDSSFFKKPRTVYDIRLSKSVKEFFGKSGIQGRSGRVFIQDMMIKNNADLGGELTGHFFFKRMHYAESTALTMLKLLKIISESGTNISELIKPFQKYYFSGEINLPMDNTEQWAGILSRLKAQYKDGKLNDSDGIAVEYQDWWFLVRSSNTEPLMRLIVEANTKELMEKKKQELIELIKTPA